MSDLASACHAEKIAQAELREAYRRALDELRALNKEFGIKP